MSQQEAEEQAQDPIIQMRQKELEIREAETMAKIEDQKARLELDRHKVMGRDELERTRIESQERQTGARIGAELTSDLIDLEGKQREIASMEGAESSKAAARMTENLMGHVLDEASKADEKLMDEVLKPESEEKDV